MGHLPANEIEDLLGILHLRKREAVVTVGILLILLDIAFFTLGNVVARFYLESVGAVQLVALRYFASAAILFVPVAMFYSHRIVQIFSRRNPGVLFEHISRSTIGCFSSIAWYYAVTRLPLSTATCIFFTKTFFMTIYAKAVFGERILPTQWLLMLIGTSGVVFILQPETSDLSIVGLIAAIAAAGLSASVSAYMRKISSYEAPLVATFLMAVFAAPTSAVIALGEPVQITATSVVVALILGLLLVGAQMSSLWGLPKVSFLTAAAFEYLRLVAAVMADIFVFGYQLALPQVAGLVLIVAATTANSYLSRRPPQPLKTRAPASGTGRARL